MPFTFLGQTFKDTIFTIDKQIIPCTITLVNENNAFFTDKRGEGQMLSLGLISLYSQNGSRNIAKFHPGIRTIDTLATINGELLKDLKTEYIQIMGYSKMFSTKLNIQLDYGQWNDAFDNNDMKLLDGKGKTMTFNSMIDALNFFSLNGFEFVQAYAFSTGGSNVYHYLLRKRQK
jgi:hypothetical protein